MDTEKESVIKQEKPSETMLLILKTKELRDAGLSQDAIACTMDKEESWVKGSLAIVDRLPQSAQSAINIGQFSRPVALQLLLAQPVKLEKIIEEAIKLSKLEEDGKL